MAPLRVSATFVVLVTQGVRTADSATPSAWSSTSVAYCRPSEPLLRQALEAIRAHQQAVDEGRPAEVIKRLRLEADHLYQTVIDYQLHKADMLGEVSH